MKDAYIVIPAKDESPRICGVLTQLRDLGYQNIVVVNDGSSDDTAEVARLHGAQVVNHIVNLGAGAATQTGIEYAMQCGAQTIVTIDADHQHLPHDIESLIRAIQEKKVDVALGSRFFGNNPEIPTSRYWYNKVGNIVAWIFTGMWVNDSQSGMKAFTADFARKSEIKRNGYEFCIEILRHIKMNKATWCEVPINVVYTKETLQKGQSFFNGVKMVFRMSKAYL